MLLVDDAKTKGEAARSEAISNQSSQISANSFRVSFSVNGAEALSAEFMAVEMFPATQFHPQAILRMNAKPDSAG